MKTLTRILLSACILLAVLPASFDAPRRAGAAPLQTVTHDYTISPALAIPEQTPCLKSTLSVPDSFPIADLNVGVWIRHTNRSNLEFTLTSPAGTEILLFYHAGSTAANINARFDDAAPSDPESDISTHVPPPPDYYSHVWKPREPLGTFTTEDAQGDWLLTICDDTTYDFGALETWALSFETDQLIVTVDQPEMKACIGHDGVHPVTVMNTTLVAQSFTIDYLSAWPVNGPAETPVLEVGETWQFQVEHRIPWEAAVGDSDDLEVTLSGGGHTAGVNLTTRAVYLGNQAAPLARSAAAHSVVYHAGKLYRIGGISYSNFAGALDDVDIFDTVSETWSSGAPLPEARALIDCAAIGDKIYCAGGSSNLSEEESDLLIYDVAANAWSRGASMTAARIGYAGLAFNGKYYVLGGMQDSRTEVATLWEYDPATDSWNYDLPDMSTANSMLSAQAVAGKIYAAGGNAGPNFQAYDPAANTWSYPTPLPSPIMASADAVLGDRYLVLLDGISLPGSNSVQLYDTQTDTWTSQPSLANSSIYSEADGDGANIWNVGGLSLTDMQSNNFNTHYYLCAESCSAPAGLNFSFSPGAARTGQPMTFTGQSVGGAPLVTYSWDFGDGIPVTGKRVHHTFTEAGAVQVKMTTKNCAGETSITRWVYVLAAPALAIQPGELEITQGTNSLADYTLEVCNQGDDWLYWDAAAAASWLSLDPGSGLLVDGGCGTLTVTVDTGGMAAGAYTASIEIGGNDPSEGTIPVPVTLTVDHRLYLPFVR